MNWLLARQIRPFIKLAAVASLVLNLALLAPALYMLQVFDRVFASGSIETLVMLGVPVLVMLVLGYYMDAARGRMLAAAGRRVESCLAPEALAAELEQRAAGLRARRCRRFAARRGATAAAARRARRGGVVRRALDPHLSTVDHRHASAARRHRGAGRAGARRAGRAHRVRDAAAHGDRHRRHARAPAPGRCADAQCRVRDRHGHDARRDRRLASIVATSSIARRKAWRAPAPGSGRSPAWRASSCRHWRWPSVPGWSSDAKLRRAS